MWPNVPLAFILVWHRILNVLQVVVGWQVQVVRRGDVVIDKLVTILDHSKSLVGVVLLARLDVYEVLLDVLGLLSKGSLFFKLLLQFLFVAEHSRLRFAQLFQ